MDKVFIVYRKTTERIEYKAVFTSNDLAQKYIDKCSSIDKMFIAECDVNPNGHNIQQDENFYLVQLENAGGVIRAQKYDYLPGHNLSEKSYLDYGKSKGFELFASSLEQAIEKAKLRFAYLQ